MTAKGKRLIRNDFRLLVVGNVTVVTEYILSGDYLECL